MFSRRRFLTDISLSSAAMLSSFFPSWVTAAIDDMTEKDEQEFLVFMSLSRYLTGFDELDPNLGRYFYAYQKKQSSPILWSNLFTKFKEITVQADEVKSDPDLTILIQEVAVWDIAKAVTKLWYSGWLSSTDDIPDAVKAQAYKGSLAWKVMGITAKGQPTGRLWQNGINSKVATTLGHAQ